MWNPPPVISYVVRRSKLVPGVCTSVLASIVTHNMDDHLYKKGIPVHHSQREADHQILRPVFILTIEEGGKKTMDRYHRQTDTHCPAKENTKRSQYTGDQWVVCQELDHGEEVREDGEGAADYVTNLQDEGEVDHQAVDNSPLGGRAGKEIGLE